MTRKLRTKSEFEPARDWFWHVWTNFPKHKHMQTNRHASIQLRKIFPTPWILVLRYFLWIQCFWPRRKCTRLNVARHRICRATLNSVCGNNFWFKQLAWIRCSAGSCWQIAQQFQFNALPRPHTAPAKMRWYAFIFLRKHLWWVVLVSSCPTMGVLVSVGTPMRTVLSRTVFVVVCNFGFCLGSTAAIDSDSRKNINNVCSDSEKQWRCPSHRFSCQKHRASYSRHLTLNRNIVEYSSIFTRKKCIEKKRGSKPTTHKLCGLPCDFVQNERGWLKWIKTIIRNGWRKKRRCLRPLREIHDQWIIYSR